MSPTHGATRTAHTIWRVTEARPTRSARPALAAAAALAALVLLTVGIALGRGSVDSPRDPAVAAPPSHTSGTSRGTPGSQRTEAGAVTAATGFLTVLSFRSYITDPVTRVATIRAIVIPTDRDRLSAAASAKTDPAEPGNPLAAAFGAVRNSAWRLTPVGYRLDGYSSEQTVVEIWAVQVTAGIGTVAVPAAASWTTTRLPLQWAEGGWKLDLDHARTLPGPTPGAGVTAQSPDLDVVTADGQFEEYDHVTR